MSRFKRLSHVIWCCKYHVVWVPKYRFRILKGPIAEERYITIHVYCGRMGCEVIELNIQSDHVHMLVSMPPIELVSKLLGIVKGKTAIQIFRQFCRWIFFLPDDWYLLSDMEVVVNWESSSDQRWTVPIGAGIGKLFAAG